MWELQEQICQQHVCQHTNVVQTGQAGWMVLILQWKMVKLKGRSALVAVLQVVKTQSTFLWRTAHPTKFTNFFSRPVVQCASVAQTDYAERNVRNNRIHNWCISRIWRHDLQYFGRYLRWYCLVNAFIKNHSSNDNRDSWRKKKLISVDRRVIFTVWTIEK